MTSKVWFEIYQDSKKEWRWRLRARNRKILADSGEGYKRKAGVEKSITRLHQYFLINPPYVGLLEK